MQQKPPSQPQDAGLLVMLLLVIAGTIILALVAQTSPYTSDGLREIRTEQSRQASQ